MKSLTELNPDLLYRVAQLCHNKESGQLIFEGGKTNGFIVFYEGRIAWAASSVQDAKFGDIMIKTGRVSSIHFEMAKDLYYQYNGEKRVCELLLEIADFDVSTYKNCLKQHTVSAMVSLLKQRNENMAVRFKQCLIVSEDDITFTIDEIFDS